MRQHVKTFFGSVFGCSKTICAAQRTEQMQFLYDNYLAF